MRLFRPARVALGLGIALLALLGGPLLAHAQRIDPGPDRSLPLPDLTIGGMAIGPPFWRWQNVNGVYKYAPSWPVTCVVSNVGPGSAGPFDVPFAIKLATGEAFAVANVGVTGLPGYSSRVIQWSLPAYPRGSAVIRGPVRITAIADGGVLDFAGVVSERNEENNVYSLLTNLWWKG